MKHIKISEMSKSVRYLWELGELHDLSPEELAPYVGVHFTTVYRWFQGFKPLPAHEALILEAIKKIEGALPDPFAAGEVEIQPGVFVSKARWAKRHATEPEALDDVESFLCELENKIRAAGAALPDDWDEMSLQVTNAWDLARKYNVKLPKI